VGLERCLSVPLEIFSPDSQAGRFLFLPARSFLVLGRQRSCSALGCVPQGGADPDSAPRAWVARGKLDRPSPVSSSLCPATDGGGLDLGSALVRGSWQSRDPAQKDPSAELMNVIGSDTHRGGLMINPTSASCVSLGKSLGRLGSMRETGASPGQARQRPVLNQELQGPQAWAKQDAKQGCSKGGLSPKLGQFRLGIQRGHGVSGERAADFPSSGR